MHCVRNITKDITWVGGSDRRLSRFENMFPLPKGVSYNAYVVLDEKTVLLDTADRAIGRQFIENVEYALLGRKLDYLIVNHMEPDHCAWIEDLVIRYPDLQIIGNAKTFQMIRQFYTFDIDSRALEVKDGDTFSSGKHTFRFIAAPMVHWPEVMTTYDETDKVLFSADAFGTFGALNGNIFADELDFDRDWLDEARRYYTNIVGKYGTQVQVLLNKVCGLDIQYLCPLHGPIWRENISYFVEKYKMWSTYEPEEKAVMIAYASMYGDTENAANLLAIKLADEGVRKIAMFDVSETDVSYLISEAFRVSHIVLAAPTYNAAIYPKMEHFLIDMKALNLQKRAFSVIQNGTWAPASGKLMTEAITKMKETTVLSNETTIKSSVKEEQYKQLEQLAKKIAANLL